MHHHVDVLHGNSACSGREVRGGASVDELHELYDEDPLSPSRGIVLGVAIGVALWCVIVTTVLFL